MDLVQPKKVRDEARANVVDLVRAETDIVYPHRIHECEFVTNADVAEYEARGRNIVDHQHPEPNQLRESKRRVDPQVLNCQDRTVLKLAGTSI